MTESFTDNDLGEVNVVRNARAKNVIARRKINSIQLTVPSRFTMKQIIEVFEKMKPRIEDLKVKSHFLFSPHTEFKTFSFVLKLETGEISNYYMSLKEGILSIVCPNGVDFTSDSVQEVIRNLVEKAMRYEAKRIFPEKLKDLAQQYNFQFTDIKINKSRSRWGSCSSKKSINLSYYCMLLPEYLVDFIMLHELCHTIEMNHGTNFWKLLDNVTNGRARQLTNELKSFSTTW